LLKNRNDDHDEVQMTRAAGMTMIGKVALSAVVLVGAGIYPLSYCGQIEPWLRTTVLAGCLFVFVLSWYRWMWCIYAFVFCIPLFNTLQAILGLPWPSVNVNFMFLAALLASWCLHAVWRVPLSDKAPTVYCVTTPFDGWFAALALLVVLSTPVGWARFNDIACPGFYYDMPRQLLQIPFFTQLHNYLAFTRAWQFLQAGLTVYLLCSSIRHRHELRRVLWLVAIAGALVSLYGLYQYYAGLHWVGINWYFRRINATLNGPHAAGIYFATLLALCLTLMIATQSLVRKVLLFLTVVIVGAGLWLTGTRSAAFSLVFVLSIVALLFWCMALLRSKHARTISLLIGAFILFVGPGYSLVSPERGLLSVVVDSPQYRRFTENLGALELNRDAINQWLAFRFYHWTAAARVVRDHTLLGSGLGTFDKLYRSTKLAADTYKTAYTHAVYLDVFAEMGVLALIAVLGIYCTAIILSWKLYRAREVSWRWKLVGLGILIAVCTTYVANFVTSDFFYVTELQLWIAFLLALLIRNFQINFDPEPHALSARAQAAWQQGRAWLQAHRRGRVAVYAAGVVLCGVWLTHFAYAVVDGYRFFRAAQPYTLLDNYLEYGIYDYQRDAFQNKFARTAAVVYKPLLVKNRYMRVYLRAQHPDAETWPVPVSLRLDDVLIGTTVLSNRQWQMLYLDLSAWQADLNTNRIAQTGGVPAVLSMTSGRTWNPHQARRARDNRAYGADLGAIEWGYY
jgi:O-antigen ligase